MKTLYDFSKLIAGAFNLAPRISNLIPEVPNKALKAPNLVLRTSTIHIYVNFKVIYRPQNVAVECFTVTVRASN